MAKHSEDWLPTDLLTRILVKLPVKSIIRFKSVKKTWCHHFQNLKFISLHFNISKKKKRVLVFCRTGTLEDHVYLMCLFVDQPLISYQDMRQKLPYHLSDRTNLDFCVENGLFCFFDDINSQITLYNPAIREFRILSEYNENIPLDIRYCTHVLGFGLDPLSNDYKVIHIRRFVDKELINHGQHYAVYKMNTDSWKVLRKEDLQLPEPLMIYPNDNNACVNGVYYWQTGSDILAFYFGAEVFQLIQPPYPGLFGRLVSLQYCISLWDTESIARSDKSNEVWVLNEEGHWTKLLKIEHILEVESMFGFWKNNMVFVQSATGQLLLYNLETKEFSETGIKSVGSRDFFCLYTYEENLVATRRN